MTHAHEGQIIAHQVSGIVFFRVSILGEAVNTVGRSGVSAGKGFINHRRYNAEQLGSVSADSYGVELSTVDRTVRLKALRAIRHLAIVKKIRADRQADDAHN